MITPSFKCTQNDNFVIISVSLPHVKMTGMEYTIVDNTFRLYVKPYFLRLSFAEDEEFVNDGTDYAQYDPDKSVLFVYAPKKEKGKEWTDLDMLTRLLSRPNSNNQFNATPSEAVMTPKTTIRKNTSTTSTDASSNNSDNSSEAAKTSSQFSFDFESAHSNLKAFPSEEADEDMGDMAETTSTPQKRPLIEVISERNFDDDLDENGEYVQREVVNKDQFDFSWEQTVPKPLNDEDSTTTTTRNSNSSLLNLEEQMEDEEGGEKVSIHSSHYGFNQQYSDVFTNYTLDLITEVIDLPTPENSEPADRTRLRRETEVEVFDVEHYLTDLVNDEMIQEIMKFKPRFASGKKKEIIWNEIEQTMLSSLPKRKYLINDERMVYLSLVDILCAYCYNHRSFMGENNVESAWTISKMSCTLSWFEQFDSLHYCLKSFIGRVLCYPLYRHMGLAKQCIRDVVALLKSGKSQVLRALLEVKYIMEHSPGSGQYLLVKLYMNDYCSWIQNENENRLTLLANEIEATLNKITTADFEEFQLSTIEKFAQDSAEELKREMESQMDHSKPVMI